MTRMFEQTLALTSVQLLSDPRLASWSGHSVECWLYEDHAARMALQARLRGMGMDATVRSAYKPLLHFFLEDIDLAQCTHVNITYPVVPGVDAKRFMLEAYPLARRLAPFEVSWTPEAQTLLPAYRVTLTDQQGQVQEHAVVAPNRWMTDHLNERVLCPAGYLRVTAPNSTQVVLEQDLPTEIESVYAQVMQWVCQHGWGQQEPYFERLEIRVELPGAEILDADGTLMVSTLEALHEDLYFSILEFFQQYSGRPKGDRGLQPGQIVPDIRHHQTEARISIILHPVGSVLPALVEPGQVRPFIPADLTQLQGPLPAVAIASALAAFNASPFECISRQGRVVQGMIRPGRLPAIVLTAGQHANEPSGVVGALRGGHWLASQPEAHFALVPLENPDGYQLQQEYCTIHPQHMHHAARYTGLGDDLEYREHAPWYESAARMHALECTGAQLHLSLHGYPAHEWTRPFTGYLPRGFELWSIPKGFFLIVRYRQAYQQIARDWLELITEEISRIPGLAAYNREQLAVYATHAGSVPFEVHHGIACIVTQNDQQTAGIKLVTEFPDETVYGEAFQFAQMVQTETVRIASTAWWQLT